MQLVEITELVGVRVSIWTLHHPGTPLRFVLFPMIHVGEPRFFAEVADRVRQCDLVVAEGIVGTSSSKAGQALASVYTQLNDQERFGLVVQDIDYRALGVPVLTPDMTATEFEARWREVPLLQRVMARTVLPAAGFAMAAVGSRRLLAWALAQADEQLTMGADEPYFEAIEELVQDRRDRLLVDALTSIHDHSAHEPVRVAVVYGAAHIFPVVRGLWPLGYRPRDGEWLTVFRY